MRTTIELSDHHHRVLLELAAARRARGFSGLIAEAIDAYLREQEALRARDQLEALDRAFAAFTDEQAEHFANTVAEGRRRWR